MSSGALNLSGGTLGGGSTFTVPASGVATLANGTLAVTTFNVSAGGTANISNVGFAPPFFQPATINNSGTVNWTAASAGIRTASGATTFNNLTGGVFNIQGTATWDVCCSGGSVAFNNQSGATLTKSSSGSSSFASGVVLSSSGTLNVNAGTLTLTGGGTLQGSASIVPGAVLDLSSNFSLTAALSVTGTGTFQVNAGTFTLAGKRVDLAGGFATNGSGTVTMTNVLDTLSVGGNAAFNGGLTAGLITAGGLIVGGSFSATGAAFDATGVHTTILNGAAAQTLTWAAPVAGKGYNNLTFQGAGTKSFSGNQTIVGNVLHLAGSGHVNGSFTITIGGNVTDQTATFDAWNGSSSVVLTGTPTVLPKHFGVNTLTFNGGTVSLTDSLGTGIGFMVVDGASAHLKLNGHKVRMSANFTTQNGGVLDMTNAADTLDVAGSATFNGGSTAGLLTRGYMNIGSFSQGGNTASFSADSTLRTSIGRGLGTSITFANPGFGPTLSHFGEMMIGDGSTHTLLSTVFVEGQLSTNPLGGPQFPVTSANLLITARGLNANHLFLTNTRVLLLDGSPVTLASDVQFRTPMDPTLTQFEVQRSGTAGTGDFAATLLNPIFNVVPTTGLYLKATDTNGGAPFLTINVSGPTPATHGGFVSAVSGAIINGWLANITLTFNVVSGAWNVAGNWSPAQVPTANDNVIIPAGNTANITAVGAIARDLTIVGTGVLAQGNFDIDVMGNIVTDPALGGITCVGSTDFSGITYQPGGDGSTRFVRGQLCRYHSGDHIQASGRIVASKVFHVHDSTFTFAGNAVQTVEAWVATTAGSTGALIMTNALDSLIVSDSLWVGDPVSTSTKVSTLTNGVITIGTNFRQVGVPGTGYFNATGTHLTSITGGAAGPHFITFADSSASAFSNLTVTGFGMQLPVGGYAKVRNNLNLKTNGFFGGNVGRLVVGGTLFGSPSSSITTKNLELGGVYSDTGTFSPDTAVFSGGTVPSPQIIPDTLPLTTSGPSLKNVRVTGVAVMIPNSAQFNWLVIGNLIVSGSLQIGTGSTIAVTLGGGFSTVGGGVLTMNSANSTLNVSGITTFGGGSTAGSLTNGTINFNGAFTQLGATTSYAPSGNHTAVLAGGVAQTITFTNPATSGFQNLTISGTSTAQLASDVSIVGTLGHTGASAVIITSGATPRLVTAAGLLNTGPATLFFTNTQLKYVDGTANGIFNNVIFSGFAASSPLTFFEIARTAGGPFTFSPLTFSGTLSIAGRYAVNSGSTSVAFPGATPTAAVAASICGCVTFKAVTGTGSLIWP
jgi:hypothetical protein